MRTVLIVDDNAGFRRQIRALLEADGFLVVGESADGASAIRDARASRPDVVLLDIGLPDMEGFEVARVIVTDNVAPMIVFTSSREAATYGPRLAVRGVAGFISKDELSGPGIRALASAG